MSSFEINEDISMTSGNNWTRRRMTPEEWNELNYKRLKSHERDEKLKKDEERSRPKRPFEIEEQYEPGKRMVKNTPKYTYRFNAQVENEFDLGDVFNEIQEILNVNKIIYGEVNMNLGLNPSVEVEMLSADGMILLTGEVEELTSKYKLELSGKDECGNDVLIR